MSMDQRVWLLCLLALLCLVYAKCDSPKSYADSKPLKGILKRYYRDTSNGKALRVESWGVDNRNNGSITSPEWPENYPNAWDDWTLIHVDPDKKIFLNFEEISLEVSVNCDYDYVEVFDGPTEDSPKLGRYCEQPESPLLTSTSNTVLVHFHSDFTHNEKGFKANFNTTGFLDNQGHIEDCRWERGYRNGTITSPGYPEKYPSNALCRIELQAPEDQVIEVSFQRLNVEDDIQCRFDYVELREGHQMENQPFAKICGRISSVPSFRSYSNKILVSFRSDESVEYNGFLMTYSFHENI